MDLGGASWRGWFPLHGELTSGKPDGKEGICFGREEPNVSGFARGKNMFLNDEEGKIMKIRLLKYLENLEKLAELIISYIALALGLEKTHFLDLFSQSGGHANYYFRAFNHREVTE